MNTDNPIIHVNPTYVLFSGKAPGPILCGGRFEQTCLLAYLCGFVFCLLYFAIHVIKSMVGHACFYQNTQLMVCVAGGMVSARLKFWRRSRDPN